MNINKKNKERLKSFENLISDDSKKIKLFEVNYKPINFDQIYDFFSKYGVPGDQIQIILAHVMPEGFSSLIYAIGFDFQEMKPFIVIDSGRNNSISIVGNYDQKIMDIYLRNPNIKMEDRHTALCTELLFQENFLHRIAYFKKSKDLLVEEQLKKLGELLVKTYPNIFLILRTATASEACFEFVTTSIESLKIIDHIIENLPFFSKIKFIKNDSIEWGKFVKRTYSNVPIIIPDYFDFDLNENLRVNCFMDVSEKQKIPRFLLWWHLHKDELIKEIDTDQQICFFQNSIAIALQQLSIGIKCSFNKNTNGKYILSLLPDGQDQNIDLAYRILDIYTEHDNWEIQIRFTNWNLDNFSDQQYVTY